MKSKPTQKKSGPDCSKIQIWEARDYTDAGMIGYLITEPGNLDRPIYLVFLNHDTCREEATTYMHAYRILQNSPDEWWREMDACVLDLRGKGKKTTEPMPAFIYSLRCVPISPDAEFSEESAPDPMEVAPAEPRPYCHFLMVELAEFHRKELDNDAGACGTLNHVNHTGARHDRHN